MAQDNRNFGNLGPGLANLGISDIVEILGGLASELYGLGKPLQKQSYDILGGVLSGEDSGGILSRLAAPSIAALTSQQPQIQRQLSDTLSGGALAEAKADAITGQQGEMAKILSGLQNSLIGTGLETGLGLTQQVAGPLISGGGLRAAQASSKQKGGKK